MDPVEEQAGIDAMNDSIVSNARVKRERDNERRIANLEKMVKEIHDSLFARTGDTKAKVTK